MDFYQSEFIYQFPYEICKGKLLKKLKAIMMTLS